eukprot:g4603.t1
MHSSQREEELEQLRKRGTVHVVKQSFEEKQHVTTIYELREKRENLHVKALQYMSHEDFKNAFDAAFSCLRIGVELYSGNHLHYELVPDVLLLIRVTSAAGDNESVETFLERASEIAQRAIEDHPDKFTGVAILGAVTKVCFEHAHESTKILYPLWLEKTIEIYGEEHPVSADCFTTTSAYHIEKEEFNKALNLAGRGLVAQIACLGGETFPCVGDSYYNIGLLFRLSNNATRSVQLLEQARSVYSFLYGINSLKVAQTDSSIAVAETKRGNLWTALEIYNRAYNTYTKLLGPKNEKTVTTLKHINEVRTLLSQPPSSEPEPDDINIAKPNGTGQLASFSKKRFTLDDVRAAISDLNGKTNQLNQSRGHTIAGDQERVPMIPSYLKQVILEEIANLTVMSDSNSISVSAIRDHFPENPCTIDLIIQILLNGILDISTKGAVQYTGSQISEAAATMELYAKIISPGKKEKPVTVPRKMLQSLILAAEDMALSEAAMRRLFGAENPKVIEALIKTLQEEGLREVQKEETDFGGLYQEESKGYEESSIEKYEKRVSRKSFFGAPPGTGERRLSKPGPLGDSSSTVVYGSPLNNFQKHHGLQGIARKLSDLSRMSISEAASHGMEDVPQRMGRPPIGIQKEASK